MYLLRSFSIFALLAVTSLLFIQCDDDEASPGDPSNESYNYNHRSGVGQSAADLLSDPDYAYLIVELQFVEGFVPTDDAIEAFEDFLDNRLNKEGIEVRRGKTISKDDPKVKDRYTTSDVVDLETEHREQYTREDTITAYMVFLNGESDRDDDQTRILGIAYHNTSMAVFQETVEDVSGSGIEAPERKRVEQTVINHEMGHILGLVDIGSPMQTDHKDEGRGAHCKVEDCLMYFRMKQDDLVDFLLGGSNPELDEYCIEDLRANGGK